MPAAPSTLSALLSAGFTEEVAVLDGGLRLVEANATFLAARAASLDAIRLHPCHEVLPGCASSCRESRAECPVHEAMETGGPVSLSVLDAQVGGETRHLRIDVYPVPASIGEPPRILHITRDITRRVEDERLRERMWTEILLHTDKLYASMLASHRDAGLASR